MHAATQTSPVSQRAPWTGRIVSGVTVAFLLMDGIMHMTTIAPVVQAFAQLGFPMRLALGLGILELVCVAIYVYPRTSVLGAILLTGYLGGAVAMHLRVGSSLFGETLFPVYVGIMVWGGLYLRERQLHALIPIVAVKKTTMSKKMLWAGRAATAVPALLILFASIPKLLKAAPIVEGFRQAGFPEYLVVTVGIIELVCTVAYLVPRTRVLGAILMTGLMGGATATNLRVGDPSLIATVVLGVLAWAGLFWSDERVRALIPSRS